MTTDDLDPSAIPGTTAGTAGEADPSATDAATPGGTTTDGTDAAGFAGSGDGGGGSDPIDVAHERAKQGIEHLQAAARELIAAARAALDVAEDIVEDPDTLTSLTGVADSVADFVRSVVPGRRGDTPGGPDEGGEPAVQRIPVT